jgi:hypothetical protein
MYLAKDCISLTALLSVARGWHRLHALNPADSAACGSVKKRTFPAFAGLDLHDGRQ